MSTRGALVFRVNGEDKITYNHSDSYPAGLGRNVAEFVQKIVREDRVEEFKTKAANLVTPREEDRDQAGSTWYKKCRADQGLAEAILDFGTHPRAGDGWMSDSLFNEWSFVINFDESTVEVYQGFQRSLHAKGRYCTLPDFSRGTREVREYWPVALIRTMDFDSPFLLEAISDPEKPLPDLVELAEAARDLAK